MKPVVLVVGPPLAGVGGVVEALRDHLPGHVVVEAGEVERQSVPRAVVAVFSAVAPLTGSDWQHAERAAGRADLVIGVVAKTDAHRGWRGVLQADRELVAGWAPHRPRMPWIGVAAAPDVGLSDVGDLVELLGTRLAKPGLDPRNRLQPSAWRPAGRTEVGVGRTALQLERVRLLRFVRDRCATMRVEFRDAAAAMPIGGRGVFESMVMAEARRYLGDLDDQIALAIGSAAAAGGEPLDPPPAPSSSKRLETRLMMVLGAGFGMGVALAASRLLAALGPGLSVIGLAVGGVIGLALTVWVVRVRGLLHDRALSERWAADVTATLKWHGDAVIAERLLTSEMAFAADRAAKRRDRGL